MGIERLAPVIPLDPDDRAGILDHLLQLDVDDRCRRFGAPVRDSYIAGYVERLDFVHDLLLGIRFGEYLVAMAHVGIDADKRADLALSVQGLWRGNWLGRRLFDESVIRARARNVTAFACAHGHPAVIRMAGRMGLRVRKSLGDPHCLIEIN